MKAEIVDDLVAQNQSSWKFLSPSFKKWIQEHQGEVFRVVDSDDTSIKLKGTNFWISKNFVKIIE